VLQANLLLEAGDVDAAIAAYDAVVNYKSDFHPAYLNRARARLAKGDFDRALADSDRAAQLVDDVALASATRAEILYRKGDYGAALTSAERTLTLKTVTPIAYAMALLTRGKCYASQDKHELALEDFKTALNWTSNPAITKEVEEAALALNLTETDLNVDSSLPNGSDWSGTNGHHASSADHQAAISADQLAATSTVDSEALQPNVSAESPRNSSLYKFKMLLLALGGYAYIFMFPVLLIVLVTLIIWSIRSGEGLNSRILEAETVLLILTTAMLRAVWGRPCEPKDLALTREQAPALFETVEEIRRDLMAPRVHAILIGESLDVSLVTMPRLGLFGQPRNYLTIGMPMLFAASPAELRALLTHELGHFARRDAERRFSSWIYQLRLRWWLMRWTLDTKQYWLTSVFNRFFKSYVDFFRSYSTDLVKQHELNSDRLAANLNGSEAFGDALIRSRVYQSYLYRHFWEQLNERVKTESSPPPAYTEMRAALRTELDPDQAREWLDEALTAGPWLSDEHPSLKDRLAALGQQPRLPKPVVTTAGEFYLAEHLDDLTRQFDRAFYEFEREDWFARHELLKQEEKGKSKQQIEEELLSLRDFYDLRSESTPRSVLAEQKAIQQSRKHVQVASNTAAERSDVSHLDRFSSHDLPTGVVEQLRDELAKDGRVREAYLVRKEVRYDSERPFHALGVVIERPWYKQLAHEWSFTRQSRYKLLTPHELYTFELASYHKRLREKMRSVDNSLIYQRG
jgi:Zn-dependent protease with chaperone function